MLKDLLAIVAVMSLSAILPAAAADFGDESGYEEPTTSERSPYDDPRYAYMYGRGQPPPVPYTDEPPVRRYEGPYEAPRAAVPYHPCMSRPEIRRHASLQGWDVLRWQDITRTTATFVAERRVDGRIFDVTVDRCSAQLLAVSPVRVRYEDYAWRRRIYDRPF